MIKKPKRRRNIQICFRVDELAFRILNDNLKLSKISKQEFFLKKIKEPLRYISTKHTTKIQMCNRELNKTGKEINEIGKRIINENVYESDINAIYILIQEVLDCQQTLSDTIDKYFKGGYFYE